MGRGVPLPSRLESLWERRKLPGRETILGRFICDFTHILVLLTTAWKWEIPTSLYWLLVLVGLMFPFNSFGGVEHPNLNFWGVQIPMT